MTTRAANVLSLVIFVVLLLAGAPFLFCTHEQQQQARDVLQVGKGLCSALEVVSNDPRVAQGGLTREEQEIAIDAIMRARQAAARLAGSSSAPAAASSSAP